MFPTFRRDQISVLNLLHYNDTTVFYPMKGIEKLRCSTERFNGTVKQNTIYELEVFQDGFENDPF